MLKSASATRIIIMHYYEYVKYAYGQFGREISWNRIVLSGKLIIHREIDK